MLSPTEISTIADEVARFIEAQGVRFERGSPRPYFTQLAHLSVGLTLPLVPRERLATVVLLKNYCNLWNLIVDDEMDREGRRAHLDASIQLLLSRTRGESGPAPDSSAARLLDTVLSMLPPEPSRAPLREALHFDFWDQLNGLNYEYCINRAGAVANSVEYGKYSTMTTSIKHFLDLDCLFASEVLPAATYRQLRVGYEPLGLAIKFAADIGTLKREMLEEENNFGLVRILALESGIPGLERKLESEAQFDALLPRLEPIFQKTRALAQEKLDAARKALAQVPGVDTGPLLKTISALMDAYFKRDPYFRA